jgi:hypothetical protein
MGIANTTLSPYCFGQLSNDSLPACLALNEGDRKTSCVIAFALAQKNISLCDSLSQSRSQCRLVVNPCLAADDKNLCAALQGNDPAKCMNSSACLLNYSVTKNDEETCKLIQDDVFFRACTTAVSGSDWCSYLDQPAKKDYCYELSAIAGNDVMTCTQITGGSTYSLDCFSTFAAKMNNLSICDMDNLSLDVLWQCYTNYSLITGNLSGCQKIHPLATTNTYRCASLYAQKWGDPSACQLITDTLTQRATCYEGSIIYFNRNLNWRKCGDIINFDWGNKCYTEAAKIYNDSSLCNYIETDFARTSCISSYSANQSKTG